MPPIDITPDQKKALSEAITEHAVTGDVAKPVIEFLFKESLRMGDKPKGPSDNISEHHIIQAVTKCHGSNEGAIRTLISRMRKQLADFFAHHPIGRQQR